MIVVLDSNVWISAFVFANQHGIPTRALERAMRSKKRYFAGDLDLLVLGSYQGTSIITPAEYVSGKWD